MDSSVSLEDQIWFLRVCHHILFSLYCQSCIKVHHVHVSLHIGSFFLCLLLLLFFSFSSFIFSSFFFSSSSSFLFFSLFFFSSLFTTTCTLLNWLVKVAVFLYSFLVTRTNGRSVLCVTFHGSTN